MEIVEQIAEHHTEQQRRRRGAPLGNVNARKHGFYGADALEVRALMRLQLRVAELGNAYLALAAAVVATIDNEGAASARFDRACEAIDARSTALTRATRALQGFLGEHDRAAEAHELAEYVAALLAPAPPLATLAATIQPVAVWRPAE